MAQLAPENALRIPNAKTLVTSSNKKTQDMTKLHHTSVRSRIVFGWQWLLFSQSWQYWNRGMNNRLTIETTVRGTSAQYLFWYRIICLRHSEYSSFSMCCFSIPPIFLYLSLFMIRLRSPGSCFWSFSSFFLKSSEARIWSLIRSSRSPLIFFLKQKQSFLFCCLISSIIASSSSSWSLFSRSFSTL